MKPSDVLREIPIPRDKLYYLEQKGYITPRKTLKGERELRDYSEKDLEMVRLMWQYIQQGFRYRVAYQKALNSLGNQN
jgi:DNA-binding transcriptional MerR regulator